jgi:hypothetical protein
MIATLVLWLLYEQNENFALIMRDMIATEKVDFVRTTEAQLLAELGADDYASVQTSEPTDATDAMDMPKTTSGQGVMKRAVGETSSFSRPIDLSSTAPEARTADAESRTADAQLHPLLIPGWLPGRSHFPRPWRGASGKTKHDSIGFTHTTTTATPVSTTVVVQTNASRVHDETLTGWLTSTRSSH